MEKEKFYRILESNEKGSFIKLKWDRGNGELERTVRFDGFDKKKNPLLYFEGETPMDIEKIGGYSSIISVNY